MRYLHARMHPPKTTLCALVQVALLIFPLVAFSQIPRVFDAQEKAPDNDSGGAQNYPSGSGGYSNPMGRLSLQTPFAVPEVRGPLLADVFPRYSSGGASPSVWGNGWSDGTRITRIRDNGPIGYNSDDFLSSPWGVLKFEPALSQYQTVDSPQVVRATLEQQGRVLVVRADGAEYSFHGWDSTPEKHQRDYFLKKVQRRDGWITLLDWTSYADTPLLERVRYAIRAEDAKEVAQYELRFAYSDVPARAWQTEGTSGFLATHRKLVSGVGVFRLKTKDTYQEAWHYVLTHQFEQSLAVSAESTVVIPLRKPLLSEVQELAPNGAVRRRVKYSHDESDLPEFGIRRNDVPVREVLTDIEPSAANTASAFQKLVRDYYQSNSPGSTHGDIFYGNFPTFESFLDRSSFVDLDGDLMPEIEYPRATSATSLEQGGEFHYVVRRFGNREKFYPNRSETNPIPEACRPHRANLGFPIKRRFVRMAALAPSLHEPQVVAFNPVSDSLQEVHFCRVDGTHLKSVGIPPVANAGDRLVGDINGDRRPDVVLIGSNQLGVLPNVTTSLTELQFAPLDFVMVAGLVPGNRHDLVDYNGDGLMDIVEYRQTASGSTQPFQNSLKIWLGTASYSRFPLPRFNAEDTVELPLPWVCKASDAGQPQYDLLDATGDGWSDLLIRCGNRRTWLFPNASDERPISAASAWDKHWGPAISLGIASHVVPMPQGLALFAADDKSPHWLPIPLFRGYITRLDDSLGAHSRFRYKRNELVGRDKQYGIRPPSVLERVDHATAVDTQVRGFFLRYHEPEHLLTHPRFIGYRSVIQDTPLQGVPVPGASAQTQHYASGKFVSSMGHRFRLMRFGHLVSRIFETDVETKDDNYIRIKRNPTGLGHVTDFEWQPMNPQATNPKTMPTPYLLSQQVEQTCSLGADLFCKEGPVATLSTTVYEPGKRRPWCPATMTVTRPIGVVGQQATLKTEYTPFEGIEDNECRVEETKVVGTGPTDADAFVETHRTLYGSHGLVLEAGRKSPKENIITSFRYEHGRLVSTHSPDGTVNTRQHDQWGRMVRISDNSGISTSFEYAGGADDVPAKVTVQRGSKKSIEHRRYDVLERMTSSWDESLGGSAADPDIVMTYHDSDFTKPGTIHRFRTIAPGVKVEDGWLVANGQVVGTFSDRTTGSNKRCVVTNLEKSTYRSHLWFPEQVVFGCDSVRQTIQEFLVKASGEDAIKMTFRFPGQQRSWNAERIPGQRLAWAALDAQVSLDSNGISQTQVPLSLNGKEASTEVGAKTTTLLNGLNQAVSTCGGPGGACFGVRVDALGRTRHFEGAGGVLDVKYDALGRVETRAFSDRIEKLSYFPNTELVSRHAILSPDGKTTLRVFSAFYERGRLLTLRAESDEKSTSFQWLYHKPGEPNAGLLRSVTGEDFKKQFTYDTAFRTVSQTVAIPQQEVKWVSTATLGREGSVLKQERYGERFGKRMGSPLIKQVEYNSTGVPEKYHFGKTRVENFVYQGSRPSLGMLYTAQGEQYQIQWVRDDMTKALLGVNLNSATSDLPKLSVSRAFNPRGLTDWEEGKVSSKVARQIDKRTYQYDTWGRLQNVTSKEKEDYGLDVSSRLTSLVTTSGKGSVARAVDSVAWNNRRVEFNRLGEAKSIDGKQLHRRADGVLEEFEGLHYYNDETGQLIYQRSAFQLPHGEEIDDWGGYQNVAVDGISLGVTQHNGEQFEPSLDDFRGSTWVRPPGMVWRTAYGEMFSNTSPGIGLRSGRLLNLTGGHYLEPLKIVRLGVRDYDPQLGEFLSEDPIWRPNFGPRVYANADPVNRIDPSGMEAQPTSQPTSDDEFHTTVVGRREGKSLLDPWVLSLAGVGWGTGLGFAVATGGLAHLDFMAVVVGYNGMDVFTKVGQGVKMQSTIYTLAKLAGLPQGRMTWLGSGIPDASKVAPGTLWIAELKPFGGLGVARLALTRYENEGVSRGLTVHRAQPQDLNIPDTFSTLFFRYNYLEPGVWTWLPTPAFAYATAAMLVAGAVPWAGLAPAPSLVPALVP